MSFFQKSRIRPIASLIALMMLISFPASATTVGGAKVVNEVDRDGDGYLSDFDVRLSADTGIDEDAGKYGDGLLGLSEKRTGMAPSLASRALEPRGEPKFEVKPRRGNNFYGLKMIESPGFNNNVEAEFFTVNYDYEHVQGNRPDTYIDEAVRNGWRFDGATVWYWESDSNCNECVRRGTAESVGQGMWTFDTESFKLEKPSNDRKKEVSIDANTEATLYIDGEKKGKTPWTGKMPVDVGDRRLVDIRLEADGYKTKTVKESFSPPESETYTLEKKQKPLIIDSDPQGATVRVNGKKIGETPVSKDYWVRKDLDVKVEGENDTVNYEDLNTPERKTAYLGDSDSSSGNYTGGSGFNTNIKFQTGYYEGLVTDLPDLTGLTVPEFSKSKKAPKTGEKIEFNASESYSFGYSIQSYKWNMGDGTTFRGQKKNTITYSYTKPGNYTVNLTITNSNGTKASKTETVEVRNIAPQPKMVIQGKNHVRRRPVTFNAAPSTDKDGKIVSYSWSFGDGSKLGGTNKDRVTHAYSQAGTYTVALKVTDDLGKSSTVKRNLKVSKPNLKPTASFSVSPGKPSVGQNVSFDASASKDRDGTINTYAWNLGNGISLNGRKATYNFTRNGTYTVQLIVVDDGGMKAKSKKTITVSSAKGPLKTTQETVNETNLGNKTVPAKPGEDLKPKGLKTNKEKENESKSGNRDEKGSSKEETSKKEKDSRSSPVERILVGLIKTIF